MARNLSDSVVAAVGAGIGSVTASRTMAVEPEVAWELLVDPGRWPEWGPSVTGVQLDGAHLRHGSTGRVRTPLGVWLPFEVTAFEQGRSWAWTVAGIAATTHLVEPVADGCTVSFGVPIVAAPYLAVCHAALARIERLATGPARRALLGSARVQRQARP